LKTLFLTKRVFLFLCGSACSPPRRVGSPPFLFCIELELVFVMQYKTPGIAVGGVAAPEGTITQHTTTRYLYTVLCFKKKIRLL
jgi:hypothetical protein